MSDLVKQVIGGLIVAAIATVFGWNKKATRIVVRGGKIRKTGKWIIVISGLMFFAGLAWMGNTSPQNGVVDFLKPPTIYGLMLMGYGIIFFIVGKIVAWFQKL